MVDWVALACEGAHAGGQVREGGEEDQQDQDERDAHHHDYPDDKLPE